MKLRPKNWADFQHYKDRAPAWIKLHRALLDDFAFSRLPVASRALAPLLWLLASEDNTGEIDMTAEELAFRLRMKERDLDDALKPLIDAKFFSVEHDASETLADCEHGACLEERRGERQEKKEERRSVADATRPSPDFEKFKEAYPKRGASNPWQPARELFERAVRDGIDPVAIIAAARGYREECARNQIVNTDKVAQAQTWLRQKRYLDYQGATVTAEGPIIPSENAVKFFKAVGRWHPSYGPEPGQIGCRVSPEILRQYGYGVAHETGEAA